ncbi:acyl-CoA dehydrogenase family protein [Verticiella sediminum]
MLQDSARSYVSENAPPAALRKLRDARDTDGISRPLWAGFADMGFTGLLVPEADGGLGLGFVEAGIVLEEIGRNLTASPFWATSGVAAGTLARWGGADQRERYLGRIAAGEITAALAVDETARHRPERIQASLRADGDGYVLNGAKVFVVDGHIADLLLVAARLEADAGEGDVVLALVEAGTPGVRTERTIMLDAHNAAGVSFDNVRLEGAAIVGGPAAGAQACVGALDIGRALASAELLGVAAEAFDRTLAYIKERRQFDRIIGEFQALQHRAANLYTELELSRAMVMTALQTLDTDPVDAAQAVCAAKAHVGRSAAMAVQEAVQMHGGMGMTDEFDIGLYMKRAQSLQMLLGDRGFQLERFARLRGF